MFHGCCSLYSSITISINCQEYLCQCGSLGKITGLCVIELKINGALHNLVGYNVGALGKALYTIVCFLELR